MKTYRLNDMLTNLIETTMILRDDEDFDRVSMHVELDLHEADGQDPGPVNEESLLATNAAAVVACIERAWPGSIDLARRMGPADPWEEVEPAQEARVELRCDDGHWFLWVDGAVYQLSKYAVEDLETFPEDT